MRCYGDGVGSQLVDLPDRYDGLSVVMTSVVWLRRPHDNLHPAASGKILTAVSLSVIFGMDYGCRPWLHRYRMPHGTSVSGRAESRAG